MSRDMVAEADIIWAFDLDGTIADYGKPVNERTAKFLNQHFGYIHIVTGGDFETANKNTALLKRKTIHALRDSLGNKSIDAAKIMGCSKAHFIRSSRCQNLRKNICLALREAFYPEIYIGGRATIDLMPMRNKGHVIRDLQNGGKKVVYFYDCRWMLNEEVNNDVSAIKEAWQSVRTDHINIAKDVRAWLKKLS
jgi:hypothetical protein